MAGSLFGSEVKPKGGIQIGSQQTRAALEAIPPNFNYSRSWSGLYGSTAQDMAEILRRLRTFRNPRFSRILNNQWRVS